MTLMERRRALMGAKKEKLTPLTALISAANSPIDTGITINDNVVMTVRAMRTSVSNNAGPLFYDGTTFLLKRGPYSNNSKAFNESYEPYIKSNNVKNFVIDGVNHKADWSTSSGRTFTATQFVQATQTMKLAVTYYDPSDGYTYYGITGVINGMLAHDLRPYLKNGKPGFLDIITGDFHTTEDGKAEWTYVE